MSITRRTYFSGTPCSLKHLHTSCRGTLSYAFSRYIEHQVQCLLHFPVFLYHLPRCKYGVSCPSVRHETELFFSYTCLFRQLVTNAPILSYYDSKKPLMIQCDASEKGLGAALLQEGQPIDFASLGWRRLWAVLLTDTETRYAQIVKEMLAIVFAAEKFDLYTFGHSITVESDHKPLEIILKKPLFSAPKRLQGIIMRLQRYNIEVVYTMKVALSSGHSIARFPVY